MILMRKFIIILFLNTISLTLLAQKGKDNVLNYQGVDQKKLHFGFTLGVNVMDFKFTTSMISDPLTSQILYPELNDLAPGFHVGIISNLRLTEYLDLRFLPGISLGQRNIIFYDENKNIDHQMEIESTFIDLPFKRKTPPLARICNPCHCESNTKYQQLIKQKGPENRAHFQL